MSSGARAVELDPLSAQWASSLGRQLYRARRYDEAIAQYQRSLELDPIQGGTPGRMAEANLWAGRPQEALAIYDGLEQRDGWDLWYLRGVVAAVMERTDEALEAAQRLEREGGGERWLAQIYVQLGRLDEAVAVLEVNVGRRLSQGPGGFSAHQFRNPGLDPLYGHLGFNALLERVGLPIVPPPTPQ